MFVLLEQLGLAADLDLDRQDLIDELAGLDRRFSLALAG